MGLEFPVHQGCILSFQSLCGLGECPSCRWDPLRGQLRGADPLGLLPTWEVTAGGKKGARAAQNTYMVPAVR